MRLNIIGWKSEDIRPSLRGMQFKLMDFSTEKYKWMTIKEIEDEDKTINPKMFQTFVEKTVIRTKEVNEIMSEGFEKKFLKKYHDEKTCTGEIVEFHYGNIVSAPKLMKSISYKDFYNNVPSWGIEDEVIIDAKKLGVEDIYLVDEYNNIHFITTMKKFNLIGESMSWGKTYLPLKHFEIYKYGDSIPNYAKHLAGLKIHENN